MSLTLLYVAPARFCRYNITAGFLSLSRGICIAVTGLGPAPGPNIHAGVFTGAAHRYGYAWWELSTPAGQLLRDAAHERGHRVSKKHDGGLKASRHKT